MSNVWHNLWSMGVQIGPEAQIGISCTLKNIQNYIPKNTYLTRETYNTINIYDELLLSAMGRQRLPSKGRVCKGRWDQSIGVELRLRTTTNLLEQMGGYAKFVKKNLLW